MTCKRHPRYRAKRAPRADCSSCRDIWKRTQKLGPGQKLCGCGAVIQRRSKSCKACRPQGIAPSTCACGGEKTARSKRCRGCHLKSIAVAPAAPRVLTADELGEALQKLLKRRTFKLEQLAERAGATQGRVLDTLNEMQTAGANLTRFGDLWSLERRPASSVQKGRAFEYRSRPDGTYKFGLCADKHLGSKYERLDVMESLYAWFAAEGVDRVFDCGNWIDGECRLNRFDLNIHGLEPQIDYAVERIPQHPGLKTYSVHGDDHEGWFGQNESIDIGRFMEHKMRAAGREDWIDMGFMEAFVSLVHAKTGVDSKMLVMHPGGGSSYAQSYKAQKLVESFQGGEKPAVALFGHYHKLNVFMVRNVWAMMVGCCQDQTPFLRKRSIEPVVGGAIVTMRQDEQTGAILSFLPDMRQYFVKGYYNDRWTKVGRAVMPARTVAGL